METIAYSVDVAMMNLTRDLEKFTSTEYGLRSSTFRKDQFPLDELIRTNKSVLDAMASLGDEQSKPLMRKYLEQTPVTKIINFTLR